MSSNVNDILQSVLNAPPAVDLKKEAVVEATQSKPNNLLAQYADTPVNGYNLATSAVSGRGSKSTSPLEYDLQTLSRYDLVNKYGRGIEPYIQEVADGFRGYNEDGAVRRSGTDGVKDLALGVAAGAAATGHIASLGLGLVSDRAGEATAVWMNNLIEGIQDSQSATTRAARRQNEALYRLSERDHLATPMGTMERIGRDAVSAVTASIESGNVTDVLAQATGSLLSGGVVAKAGTKALTALAPSIANSARATSLVQRGMMTGTIGGMEGGNAYADVISRINKMTHQELMEHPYYRKIYEMTGDIRQALEATKFAAAKRAGIQMAGVGALTGSIVSKFEANPLAAATVRGATRNLLTQTVEEGIQGMSSPAISNKAIQDYANPTQRISEGVGRGLGEGVIGGLGASVIAQAPGVAAQKVYDGVKYVGDKLTARIDAVNQGIKDSSPVSTKQLSPVAADLNANIQEARTTLSSAVATLPVEQQEHANDFVERLISLGSFTEGQYQNPVLDAVTQGSTSKLEALQKIGEMIADPNADQNARILGALEILITQDNTYAAASANAAAYAELSDDSPAAQTVNNILGITNQILNNPEVSEAVGIALEIIQNNPPVIAPVTQESIATPEGQQNIDTAIKVAQVAPEKGNLEANQQILYHAGIGDIQLTRAQEHALEISNALIQAERASQALGNTLNLSEDALRVNKQITLETGEKGKSIADHARGIYHALLNNDQEAAAQYLTELGNFAEHMGNKLAAINEHIANGVGTTSKGYEAWNQKARKWFTVEDGSKQALYYNPSSEISQNLVKSVFHEATLAAQVYNNMVDATGQGTKVPMPTQPSVIGSQSTASTTASTGQSEGTPPSVVIPEDRQKEVADALGVSITRIRGYSEGKPNALTESQVDQVRELLERKPSTPTSTGKGQKESQVVKGLNEGAPKKSSPSFLAPIEAAVDSFKKTSPLVGELDAVEQSVQNTTDEDARSALEDKAESLYGTISENVDEIVNQLIDQLGNLPKQVADGIRDDLFDLRDSEDSATDRRRALSNVIREARNIANSTEDLFGGDTSQQEAEGNQESGNEGTPAAAAASQTNTEADQEFSFDSVQENTEQPTTPKAAFKLNKGQQKAYDAVVSFLNSAKATFSIIGSAGTGKTTIVNEILKNPAAKKFSRVVLTSPTHRANAVTLSNNPGKNVLTLHKLLGLSPEVDIENFDAKTVKFDLRDTEGAKMRDGDLIIIDESSMINDSLFDVLVNLTKTMPNTKIIFLGDSAQLGPVNQADKSKALTSTTGSVELTEVMRAKNAELLDESVGVRNNGTFSNKTNMNNGSGVQFIGNSATFLKRAIDMFKSNSFKDNPLLGRVVAFTNAKVAEYNRKIRQELFPDNSDYAVGDLLMGYAAFGKPSTTTGLTDIANGMDYVVESVGKVRNKTALINNQQVDIPVIQLTIRDVLGINGTKTIDVVPPSMPKADREALANKLGGLINAARTNRSLWKQYYGFKEQFVIPFDLSYENRGRKLNAVARSIDYGYAHTIHKSQGGTYNYVLVDNVDINKARDPATQQQLRYVGLTRAQHGSFVLTNDPITNASPAQAPTKQTKKDVPDQTAKQEDAPTDSQAPAEVTNNPVKLTGLASVYQNLVGVVEGINLFVKSFKYPKNQRIRLVGEEQPIQAVLDILNNSLTLSDTLGTKWASRVDDRVLGSWKTLLNKGQAISQDVAKRFDAAINRGKVTTNRETGARKANPSLLAQLTSKEKKPVNKYTTGLLFNIAELLTKNGKQTAELNPELLQSATLAMIDWVINADTNREILDQRKALDTANGMLGTGAISITPEAHAMLNEGTTPEDAIRSLGSKIVKYWGLQEDANGFIGDQQGIPQSLARLFLEDLIEKGHVVSNKYVMADVDGTISLKDGSPKDGGILVIKWSVPDNNILGLSEQHVENVMQTRTLLEEVVSLDPEVPYYIGDGAIPPTSEHQLRQSLVPLTRQQKAVQKKANATEYRIDPMMVSLYGLIGREQLIEVFGGQDTTNEHLFNKNHLKSIEGQRKSISAAYDALHNLLLEIRSIAEAEGKTPEEVAVRFKHEFASVNRLFLQGPYNPQSSKLMRDALLPTWVVADMTQQENQDFFYLALAQGLGISIHRQPHENSIQQVTELLTADRTSKGKPTLKDAVPLVQKMMNQVDTSKLLDQDNRTSLDQIRGIFNDAGIEFNFLALKSLMEYVNLTQAGDLTKFKSSLYIEADGMTNGPANAMMLFNSGSFTEHWVQNMERVGFYINQPDATANTKNLSVPDMYQAGANAFVRAVEDFKKSLDADWKRTSVDNLHRLVGTFNKDFGFNDKEELTVARGFLKNPLMVMIYGSSPSGVAGAITNALVDSIYERLSEALQRQAQNPEVTFAQAMFPDSANPSREYGMFESRLASAIGQKGFRITDPANFTVPANLKQKLKTNIKFNLVDSMYAAIQETVGDTVFDNVNTMKTAVTYMSEYAALLQKQLIEKKIQQYKDTEEGYTSRQLLKKKDIAKIEEELKRVAAYIESAHQNFLVTDQAKYKVAETTSEGFDGSNRISGTIQGFAGAGVAGVAYMNQGSGDAQMVQFGYANGGSEMGRVMPAFDGMHFPFTDTKAGGSTMNTAVADSWKLNPMKAVSDAFNRFMEDVNQNLLDDDQRENFPLLKEALEHLAKEIQENHDVVSMVPSVIDQMAGTGATHQNQGTVVINSTDIAGITEELNNLKDTVRKQRENASVQGSPLMQLFAPEGSSPTQVRTIFANALPKLLESNLLDADQKNILQDILNGKYLTGWEIHIGSPKELKKLVRRNGTGTPQLRDALNSGKGGFTVPDSKQIFIMNDSAETVLHEVIQAATFEKVLAHVEGRTNNVAVERIQGMMNQFMDLTVDDYGDFVSTALQASTLQRVIREARSQGQEAVAINEFMAWTLSNRQLTELTKKQTLPKVLQIAKDAWEMLKVLIFGGKHAPKVGTDMYSNLRFNTALIIQSNMNVTELTESAPVLFHDTSSIDPDLVKLDEALQGIIVNQLRIREGRSDVQATDLGREIMISLRASEAASNAFFDMTAQEGEVFRSVVQALTVEQNLDRNISREANRLYTQVVKNLKVEDFMPEGADPSERAYANAKYSLITGASFSEIDGAGRSTILPVFFGLAMTNPEFKAILSKMEMPKGMSSEETGVDGVLENFGYKSIEALGSKFSGTAPASNIQEAMNILGNKIIENQESRENLLEVPGRWVDKVNDVVVDYSKQLANYLTPELTDAERAQRTKWEKGLAGAKSALALALSAEIGGRVAEDATATLDKKSGVHHWFRELAADLVGRTGSNALIYDMIKQVRSTVQAIRQNYRINLPKHIRKQFTRELTKQEWASLQRGIAKTDLANLSLLGHSKADIALWASNESARRAQIKNLEDVLNASKNGSVWVEKAKQLANFMNTGERGINLLRNAEAITDLLGTGYTQELAQNQTREDVVKAVDALITLYSVDTLNQLDKANLASLVQTESAGINYINSYLADMLKEEKAKVTEDSKYNIYKGFIPFEQKPNTSLVVGHETEHADLLSKGYEMVDKFTGANAYMNRGLAYYRMGSSAKASFNQGIVQTAKATSFGVDPNTGYSDSHVVKRITDPVLMKRLLQRQDTVNPLVPVYGADGNLVAVEQMMEAKVLETVRDEENISETIGKWKGRQEEEVLSQEVNKALVDRLHDIYEADPDKARYENVFDSEDPVIKDAVANIPRETRDYIHKTFGKKFMVQRNMLRDVLGYRDASVRDSWTGVTRMPASTQKAIRDMATVVMGKDAYKNMVRAEEIIENLASNAKVLIAIKSGIVPAINIISNLVHLVSRGVPLNQMRKGIPTKVLEIREYTQSKIEMMKLEADYAAATQANVRASLQAQMQAIEDSHRRLSIWPLIEAGEFTAISDADLRDNDTRITSGKWAEYFDEAVAKMPDSVNTAGRYFLVSKDTALFNGMQKAVEYGDLVAKAVLYDDLTTRKGMSKEEALGIITEEFVNYDRLPGRARGKLEKMGLMWFYNFKLRSVKIALSTMRNNPIHTLLALSIPTDFGLGDAGIPIEDNAVTMGLEGRLLHSIGPGQGLNAPALNPWLNIIN